MCRVLHPELRGKFLFCVIDNGCDLFSGARKNLNTLVAVDSLCLSGLFDREGAWRRAGRLAVHKL